MSTVEFQDRATSLGWQREVAEETIRGRGMIVAEFFDEGCSRRLSWRERPAAAQLMAASAGPNRSFDAVIIEEYERAFYGDQFDAVRTYALAGLVQCQLCGRRLDSLGQRPTGLPRRHGHTRARNRPPELARNVYVREDHLLGDLRTQFPEWADEDGSTISDFLRVNRLTIICGGPKQEVKPCGPQLTRAAAAEGQLLLL
jgi:hypothetical protein